MQTATDMSNEMANKEADETVSVKLPISGGTIISTNGHKITSKLNPDAKEFYPAYLVRQKIMREIGDVGGGGQTLMQTPPLHFAHNPNVLKVIKLDGIMANQMETDVDTFMEGMDTAMQKLSKETNRNEVLAEIKSANIKESIMMTNKENEETEKEKENKYATEVSDEIIKVDMLIVGDMGEPEKQIVEEDVRTSEEDGTDLENFEDAEGEPMAPLKKLKGSEININAQAHSETAERDLLTEDVNDEENREQYSDQGSTETLNEFKCKDDTESVEVSELSEENELAEEEALHDLPQILEEIKESNTLCGDGEGDVEAQAEGVCECIGVGDGDVSNQIINEYQSKLTTETDGEWAASECDAPPNTPTELNKSTITIKATRSSKGKAVKEKDEKKKSEKRTTLRKLASISLSLRGKSSSHHTEKTTTRTTSATMTRTKRLSESLHNLTSGLKSKVDGKKADGSSRFLPRSATNIPRPPTSRTRTTSSKAGGAESNGMNYKAPKAHSINVSGINSTTIKNDVESLKSASSSEQNFTLKPAAQLLKKPLISKSTNATSTEKSGIPTVSVTKSKDSVGKARPRGTLASTLRQSEAQKRRNLFPNDDDESNIELSQFLFK